MLQKLCQTIQRVAVDLVILDHNSPSLYESQDISRVNAILEAQEGMVRLENGSEHWLITPLRALPARGEEEP